MYFIYSKGGKHNQTLYSQPSPYGSKAVTLGGGFDNMAILDVNNLIKLLGHFPVA